MHKKGTSRALKAVLVLAAAAVLAALAPNDGASHARYKRERLRILTNLTSAVQTDSIKASLGGANSIDTTSWFGPISGADTSLAGGVQVIIRFTSALSTGDSVYLALDGSADGLTSTQLGDNAITLQGFTSAGTSDILTTGFMRTFMPVALGTTNVSGQVPGRATGVVYAGWDGFPFLRVRVKSRIAAAVVANSYSVEVIYPTAE